MTSTRTRRNGVFRIGVASILAGFIVALVGVLAAPAGAASVTPEDTAQDNPDCAALGYSFEYKIDKTPTDGDYVVPANQTGTDEAATITIDNAGVVDGVYYFDWSSDITWDAVIVKQGNGATAFKYDPAVTGDTQLHPSLTDGEPNGGISHVTFCRNNTPPPPDPECPEGTEWVDVNENQEIDVDEGECQTPEEPTCPEGTEWVDENENQVIDEDECQTPEEPEPTIEVTVLSPICDGDVPYLLYEVETENVSGDALADGVDITWVNPDGDDVVLTGLPLSGKILWPGAVIDEEGNPLDWPGWTKQADGSWVEGDEFDWVRPNVDVIFAVNPEITVNVGYPPATPDCDANPPEPEVLPNVITPNPAPPQVAPQQLPRTGSGTSTLTLVGLGLVLIGAGAMYAGRRELALD